MEPETMGSEIAAFVARQHDGSVLTAEDLERLLRRLNDLSSQVHTLPAGDLQATTAKLDELRRQYSAWLDAASEQEATGTPVITIALLDQEYCGYRDQWSSADARQRGNLEAKIIDCLARVEARPDSDQLSAQVRTFLRNDAGLSTF